MPATSSYPAHWEADVVLRDGATAHLRPIRPEDAQAVQRFHSQQSQTSVYMRFFTFKSELSAKELRRFTEVDCQDRVALVITLGEAIIGIGRFDRLKDPQLAEVAFNIADAHQGRGLGSILLEHLGAIARERGIRRFTAEVLPENRKMLTVFSEAGYEVSRHFDDGVVSLTFDIDPTQRSREVMESREHRSEARSLTALLNPAKLVLISAPDSAEQSVADTVAAHIVESGHEDLLTRLSLGEGSCEPAPDGATVAVICVPYAQVPEAMSQAARIPARAAVIVTSGFADDGESGAERQRGIVAHARSLGMRILGPASLGLINTGTGLNASILPTPATAGNVGLFTQSAALGTTVFAAAEHRGLGIADLISAGNRADISGNDVMQFWEDESAIAVAGLYLESIGNPRKFSRIARRLSAHKPVIVAKSEALGLALPPGHEVRTSQAPAAALDAVFRQSGVIQVATVEELMDVAQLCSTQPLPQGPRVAVLSNSRALTQVLTDLALRLDLTVTHQNPAVGLEDDAAAHPLPAALGEALATEAVDAVVISVVATSATSLTGLAESLTAVAAQHSKPVLLAVSGLLDLSVRVDQVITGEAGRLPSYASGTAALSALAKTVAYMKWRGQDRGVFGVPGHVDESRASQIADSWRTAVTGDESVELDAHAAAELLSCYDIVVLPSEQVNSSAEAVAAAERLGYPVALKSTDAVLRHRLDLGGVRLDIPNAAALSANFEAMEALLRQYGERGGSAALEVQSMAPLGQGCVVSALDDPLLGPILSFGIAGDPTALLNDWAHRSAPLSDEDAAHMVREPLAAAKLFGHQGLPHAAVQELELLLRRLAQLKDDLPQVLSVQLNPVVLGPTSGAVLSARVQVGNPRQRVDSARRSLSA